MFRGKDAKSGAWRYGSIFDSNWTWGVDSETVGQFTGMMDSEGKKIFEGDATLFAEDHFVIVWNKDKCRFGMVDHNGDVCDIPSLVKVIGNITDNPELVASEDEK